ncbi:unnamed protein product [Mytilus coruscus]|uniref:Uncharacterized protein n=1 Tax=Mytilus coruscus TaxID=42192 RepID=A0A6J8BV75_MYTCO|nr:unnamed protein product [Mytilus coruscus]
MTGHFQNMLSMLPNKLNGCFTIFHHFGRTCSLRRKCTDCCIGRSKSFHCPLCPVEKFQPAKECKLLSHLQVHWNSRFPVGNDLYAVRCSLEHDGIKNSHYHCQTCDKKTNRKARAQSHANKCHWNLCTDTRENAPGIGNVHEDEQLTKESDVKNSYTAQDDHCFAFIILLSYSSD